MASDANSGYEFGRDVAISATDAIVGAIFADGVGPRTGAAYTYNDITLDVNETEPAVVPTSISLDQNYPNPFNPSTAIRYVPDRGAQVELTIHDLLGQEIRTLVNDFQPAGAHGVTWDGMNTKGVSVAGGVYLYRLQTGSSIKSRKMLLLK